LIFALSTILLVENGHLMMGVDWAHARMMRLISKKPLLNKGLEL